MPSLKLVLRVCSSHNGLIQKTSLPIKVSFLVEYFLKRLYPLTWDQSHKVTKQFDSRHSIRLNLVIWLLFVIITKNEEATLRLSILLAISALISAQKDIIAQVFGQSHHFINTNRLLVLMSQGCLGTDGAARIYFSIF